ncbi:unnamed protein product [Owenia fusiformis]|uniref:Uncharacterized protein n=1 Tax=Owenia fusiformis TaxID=6347 RepID=A0A8J1TN53_OWEFU|nr:unnamed protein product [Owenia fusiformis]
MPKKYRLSHNFDYTDPKTKVQTTKEEQCLEKFKMQVDDIASRFETDEDLFKWLKARDLDVDKAEEMYRQSKAYKAKMDVKNLVKDYEPPEVLKKYLAGGPIVGHDKDGRPIAVELFGHLDMKGLMYSCKKVDFEKTKLLISERQMQDMAEQEVKLGKKVDQMVVVFDMSNAGTKQLWRPGMTMYTHLVQILEDNYPESVYKLFVVNAPSIFPIIWRLGRPLISDHMKNKIHVLGGNFKEELLKYIDTEELPAFLGGSQTDPDGDPKCPSKICWGGDVPEEFFLKDISVTENMVTSSVDPGKTKDLKFQIEKPGTMLRWEFKTENYDIGFGLKFTSPNGETHDVMPVERVNSHMVPEDGDHICTEAGEYTIVFDNSFSWTRDKKLFYVIETIEPTDSGVNKDLNDIVQHGSWNELNSKMKDASI